MAPSDDPEVTLSIDELSHVTGNSVRNIRAYLQLGILHRAAKQGRSLAFDATHVERLSQIGDYRDKGYSLAAIKDVLAETRDNDDDIQAITDLNRRSNESATATAPEIGQILALAGPLDQLIDIVNDPHNGLHPRR